MGGKGSGGARMGAGRKSKRVAERKLTGARHRTKALDADIPAVTGAPVPSVEMPSGLSKRARAAWERNAALAGGQGTLTPETAEGFGELCEAIARLEQIRAALAVEPLAVDGSKHPLIVEERLYMQRVEIGRKSFLLMPIGKPMTPKEAPAADPFAEFEGLRVVEGGKA